MRMVRKVAPKPVEVNSGSDDNISLPVPGPGPGTLANRPGKMSPPVDDNATPNLKRKRDNEESRASPSGVRPVVLIRRVPPVPPSSSKKSPQAGTSPLTSARPAATSSPGPTVVNGRIKMRRVVGKQKPKSPVSSPVRPALVEAITSPSATAVDIQPTESAIAPPDEQSAAVVYGPPSDIPMGQMLNTESSQADELTRSTSEPSAVLPAVDTQSEAEVETSAQGLRRTTRARKQLQGITDVFGTVAPPRSAASRRRAVLLNDNSAFSGMTALAIKTLTATNTQRNQKQVVEIQTEVIVKEGKRPDSPTTKVRTSLERQREEKTRQRQERAERRARRSGDGTENPVEGDELSDAGELSMSTEPGRHRRGPGDEEDYETPERHAKRTRLDVPETEGSDEKNERRVKWHHGLATMVYLDDAVPNPKRAPSDAPTKKGCLAPAAKVSCVLCSASLSDGKTCRYVNWILWAMFLTWIHH
jgi:hypothetical protein